jgi:hypothetical protein
LEHAAIDEETGRVPCLVPVATADVFEPRKLTPASVHTQRARHVA